MGENIVFKIDIDENLHIEFINYTHAQELFDLGDKNREFLREWLPWVDSSNSVEDTKEFIKNSLNQYAKNGSIEAPIFINRKLIGMIALLVDNKDNITKGEIGYWLDKNYIGKGIVTKCANKMLDIGFNRYNLDKIVIRCATANKSSCNVAKRLKFTFDGTLRKEAKVSGKIVDLNIYSILKEEYDKLKVQS